MRVAAAGMLLIASSACHPHSAEHDGWLVLEFPTTSWTTPGRIKGTGPAVAFNSWGYILVQARRCGAIDPVLDDSADHIAVVVSKSSANDQSVVACLKKRLALDFDAGTRAGERWSNNPLNYAPFSQFETNEDALKAPHAQTH